MFEEFIVKWKIAKLKEAGADDAFVPERSLALPQKPLHFDGRPIHTADIYKVAFPHFSTAVRMLNILCELLC